MTDEAEQAKEILKVAKRWWSRVTHLCAIAARKDRIVEAKICLCELDSFEEGIIAFLNEHEPIPKWIKNPEYK